MVVGGRSRLQSNIQCASTCRWQYRRFSFFPTELLGCRGGGGLGVGSRVASQSIRSSECEALLYIGPSRQNKVGPRGEVALGLFALSLLHRFVLSVLWVLQGRLLSELSDIFCLRFDRDKDVSRKATENRIYCSIFFCFLHLASIF